MAHKPENSRAATIRKAGLVTPELAGMRLDQAAARLFPDFSRARLQQWIRDGVLKVDGGAAKQRQLVVAGMNLTVDAQLEQEVAWHGESIPLALLHEDEHLLVVDKPAGLVVHPGAGNPRGTLVNALLHHRPQLESIPRGGIVHRLDKDTSGLLVVAASLEAHSSLVEQLQRKSVQRSYFAVIQGVPSGGATIDAAIGRHPRQRTRMAVLQHGGKVAVTHFRIAARFRDFTAVDVELETGRTHQIRVHMAHRGFPLLGDPVYGGRLRLPAGASAALEAGLRAFRRQALHARHLRFTHPATGERCSFSSDLAADMGELLALLRSENALDGQSYDSLPA